MQASFPSVPAPHLALPFRLCQSPQPRCSEKVKQDLQSLNTAPEAQPSPNLCEAPAASQPSSSSSGNQVRLVEPENCEQVAERERERSSAEGLTHQDELISSSKAQLCHVGTGVTALGAVPSFQGSGGGKRSFSPFHLAAALWNGNAGRHSVPGNFSEALAEEDQALLLCE